MKRRIGCWIALAIILTLAICIHFNDQYGFVSMIVMLVVLPVILLPINIFASFDTQLLVEVPILSTVITIVFEILTLRGGSNIFGYIGYCAPTLLSAAIVFTLTRYLKTRLVKQLSTN